MSDDRFLQKFPKYNSSEIATGGSQFGPKMKRQDGSIPEIHAEGVLDIWTLAHVRTCAPACEGLQGLQALKGPQGLQGLQSAILASGTSGNSSGF